MQVRRQESKQSKLLECFDLRKQVIEPAKHKTTKGYKAIKEM